MFIINSIVLLYSKCLMHVNRSGKPTRSPLTTDIRYLSNRVSLVATKLLNQMKYYKIFDGWAIDSRRRTPGMSSVCKNAAECMSSFLDGH